MFKGARRLCWFAVLALALSTPLVAQSYKYFRLGAAEDARTTPVAGFALMGGGKDLDAAFKWLCERASEATSSFSGTTGMTTTIRTSKGLCKANSVSTLIVPDKAAAEDPKASEILRTAEAIFIAGGDQAMYLNHWADTPVRKGTQCSDRARCSDWWNQRGPCRDGRICLFGAGRRAR